jgi:hypothetical protein
MIKFSEFSNIQPPHKIEGPMVSARENYYELAKSKIRYMNTAEYQQWVQNMLGDIKMPIGAALAPYLKRDREYADGTIERFIENLEIGVNVDDFDIEGESYKDILPFIIEHELYESWMTVKRGRLEHSVDQKGADTKHLIAQRREFLLAEEAGLGEHLLEWRLKKYPQNEIEYREMRERAQRKLSSKEKK